MVPKDWTTKTLSEIVKEKISYGIVQAGPHIPGGVPYIKSSDVRGTINPEKLQKTSQAIHFKYRRSSVHPGDIVISLRGNIGECAIVPNSLPEANLTQGTARISVNNDQCNYFHYYQLASEPIRNKVKTLSKGSTFKEISLEDLRKVTVLCPSIQEQKKISQILTSWDKAITIAEKLLANSQQQKKALMQQLLTGEKRLAGFKQAWSKVTVSNMGSISSGGTPDTTKKEYWDGGINWLTPTDVTSLKSRYVLSTNKTISEKGLKNSSAKMLPSGALLICTRATIGAMAISTTEIATNQGFKNLVPNAEFSVEFLYYLFTFNVKELVRRSSGSTFLELSKSDFEKLTFLCPCIDEQHKIASVLIAADDAVSVQQQKLNHLKQEKKALMQQLLTGKRRVKVDAA
ncbi:restriction endonuclease subunit S [Salmonella enterica subsp. enterica]|nr:restriction endonuclease subunit S [Salmonella enterica subsp. enterica serovar Brandenburg]ECE6800140.1 restriction endonuclease subunit S [Salmonella enterica subsp. enterica]EBS1750713.1 restriction endonuclease subunit S [Salmonella enterica subsp. enterica serovar Brandenburg]EBS2715622.1 restriction endonuclease subunit S [Salmonella enterica subsp. enterica serovar Brandenburg]ECD0487565.1 restriction endonuclease subunit S [Salmonella enterica subsp. enterica serovar Brandenburg]